jgi:hypothetical protein
MKKVLILADRDFQTAPRIIREIHALETNFQITTSNFFHTKKNEIIATNAKGVYLDRALNRIHKIFFGFYYSRQLPFRAWKLKKYLRKNTFDIIIVHEPELLPYVMSLKENRKVVFNAHEYYPLEYEDEKWQRTWGRNYRYVYKHYLPKASLVINVCESIAQKCREDYCVDSIVIPNAARFHAIQPQFNSDGVIRLIYHGVINPSRKIEEMIRLMDLLGEGYQLDMMIMKNTSDYYRFIEKEINQRKNVKMVDVVTFEQIIPTINKYDIGLYSLAPTNYNNSVALPNKFFEFIQARLCLAIGPSPEMKRIVEKYQLGVVSEDFSAEALSKVVKGLTREAINQYKENTHAAAHDLSSEHYDKVLREAILKL